MFILLGGLDIALCLYHLVTHTGMRLGHRGGSVTIATPGDSEWRLQVGIGVFFVVAGVVLAIVRRLSGQSE